METGSRPDSFMGGTAFEIMGVLTWELANQVSVVAKDSAPSLTSRELVKLQRSSGDCVF
ncbi:hypothetical protein LMORI2_00390 [Limnohabitans sp. MORI2]|nr:hypothetical protein LMORI2_00390 [Limnohabitans sp. MORI2]